MIDKRLVKAAVDDKVSIGVYAVLCKLSDNREDEIIDGVLNGAVTVADVYNAMLYWGVDFITYRRISERLYLEVMKHDE